MNQAASCNPKPYCPAPDSEHDSLTIIAYYWRMRHGFVITKPQRAELDGALRAGVDLARVKAVVDVVRPDIAPWDLRTRLVEAAGIKGEVGPGRRAKPGAGTSYQEPGEERKFRGR